LIHPCALLKRAKQTIRETIKVICHKSKVIYIHPCRCAGSSIEVLFGFNTDTLNQTGDRHALPDFYPKKYWREYTSFISIRNPWDRLYSGFMLAKQFNIPAYKEALAPYDLTTFNNFVAEIMTQPELYENDRLFWPQHKWFYNGKKRVKFDKVMRFENLREDASAILNKIGKSNNDFPHLLKTDKPHYREIYNNTSVKIIQDIYKKDIEMFRYNF